jgi:hypothetical protein
LIEAGSSRSPTRLPIHARPGQHRSRSSDRYIDHFSLDLSLATTQKSRPESDDLTTIRTHRYLERCRKKNSLTESQVSLGRTGVRTASELLFVVH